jgi:hypothetical protein
VKTAVLLKNGELSSFPADLYIEGEKIECDDFVRCLSQNNVKILIAKFLPSTLISELSKNKIIFIKTDNLENIQGIDINLNVYGLKMNRGAGCQRRFKE